MLSGIGDSVIAVILNRYDETKYDTLVLGAKALFDTGITNSYFSQPLAINYFDTINIRINYPCSSALRIDTQTQNIFIIGTVHIGIIGDTMLLFTT